jgi:hypothetical protein
LGDRRRGKIDSVGKIVYEVKNAPEEHYSIIFEQEDEKETGVRQGF